MSLLSKVGFLISEEIYPSFKLAGANQVVMEMLISLVTYGQMSSMHSLNSHIHRKPKK